MHINKTYNDTITYKMRLYKVLLRNKNGKYEVINNNYNISTYISVMIWSTYFI